MISCLKLLTLVLLFCALLCSLISLLTNYWIEHSNTHHQGIWYYCNDEDIGCLHFDQDPIIGPVGVPDWHYAVFGLFLISVIVHIICLICFAIILCKKKQRQCLYATHDIILAIGLIALVTAMALYTRKFYPRINVDYKWGYSFGFGWLSFIIHTVALTLSFIITMIDRERNDMNYRYH